MKPCPENQSLVYTRKEVIKYQRSFDPTGLSKSLGISRYFLNSGDGETWHRGRQVRKAKN
jgi:hypothetical protein